MKILRNIRERYYQFIVEFPSVVMLLVCLVVVILTGLGVLLNEFPTFDNPTKGFEARGTVISGRLKAFRRMYSGADGVFSCPSTSGQSNADLCSPVTRDIQNQTLADDVGDDVLGDCFKDYLFRFKMVYRATDESMEMFTSTGMKAVCQHDKENFRSDVGFDQICYYRTNGSCCPSISIGHVTASMVGKVDCDDIDDSDVLGMKELLEECVGYYSRGCLGGDGGSICSDVPVNCSADSRVYTIFHYLTPTNFALQVARGAFDLQTVIVLQPLLKGPFNEAQGAQTLYEIYTDKPRLTDDTVQVAAIDGGIKFDLFAGYLFADMIYIGIGFLVVVSIIWMYVGSLFVTIMTMVSIIFSFLIAYFFYHTIFRLVFFPFINVVTAVLLVGVGADDCFVYVDIWKLSKKEHGGGRENRVLVLSKTLKHAATTMFVTSFTTASALFAGCISSITAIRCFSVFAGSSILVNFVLTVTWIPAAVMLHEKYFICDEEAQEGSCKRCGLWFFLGRIYDHVSRIGNKFFEEVLPIIIVKLRFLWILLLTGLGIGGLCVVFVEPRLRLPSKSEFQFLKTSHILEQYDQIYKNTFSFEIDSENAMPAFIVWGIEPVDNGNHWDPDSDGTTVIDKNFDVKTPEAQMWLYNFCTDLRNASFHDNYATAPNEFCFIDLFKDFMEKTCIGNISPCCGQTTFPYSSSLFNQCVPIFYGIVCQASETCRSYIPGLWFNADNEVVGMVLTIKTNIKFTLSYDPIGQFWSDVNGFIEDRMAEAPTGLRRGWFISESGLQMSFFDLQHGLARGTPIAVVMSLAFASCILLITIRNILVTIYAIYAIACAVFVVIATVVLLGWELNIFESTVLSLAVGLSVDFTVHLGVAYRQATQPDRTSRAMHALQTLGSAVTLAALTTLVAGACMLPSTVLSYAQLGTFLIIIMTVSWVYGLFLFMSLLRTIGPQGMFAQISTSCCRREPNLTENNREIKPEEYVHEQHVNTSDERIQR